jgi:hypothetical protein
VTGRICPVYPRLRNSIFTQPLLISNTTATSFVHSADRFGLGTTHTCTTMAMTRRTRSRPTGVRASSEGSRFECLGGLRCVFQSDNDGFDVPPCRTAFGHDRRLPASVLGPLLLSACSIRFDLSKRIHPRSQLGRRLWKRRPQHRRALRRSYQFDLELTCPASAQPETT